VSSQQKDCKSLGYKYWFRDEFEVNRPDNITYNGNNISENLKVRIT
jgi:hypothetical protein